MASTNLYCLSLLLIQGVKVSMIALVVWTSKHDMKVKSKFRTWFELSLRAWVGVQTIEGVNFHSRMYHSSSTMVAKLIISVQAISMVLICIPICIIVHQLLGYMVTKLVISRQMVSELGSIKFCSCQFYLSLFIF